MVEENRRENRPEGYEGDEAEAMTPTPDFQIGSLTPALPGDEESPAETGEPAKEGGRPHGARR